MRTLTLEPLQALHAIDRRGWFAAAAEDLHRVPSAITYSVRQLEEGLGIEIFDRRGHRAVLTAAGRELLAEGRRLLQAASDLECRVQQVAKGWESELRIAVDTLIGADKLFRIAAEFYEQRSGTRLRLLHEVLGGTWDALASGRADLAVGGAGEAPPGRNYVTRALGRVEMVFVAAPFHVITRAPLPLSEDTIRMHRELARRARRGGRMAGAHRGRRRDALASRGARGDPAPARGVRLRLGWGGGLAEPAQVSLRGRPRSIARVAARLPLPMHAARGRRLGARRHRRRGVPRHLPWAPGGRRDPRRPAPARRRGCDRGRRSRARPPPARRAPGCPRLRVETP